MKFFKKLGKIKLTIPVYAKIVKKELGNGQLAWGH
jgi:hypothetical protein